VAPPILVVRAGSGQADTSTVPGKIITTGSTLGGEEADIVVGRFNLDGTPHTAFGENRGWDALHWVTASKLPGVPAPK
jgi:hypothetical protein